ncbi:MAG: ribose 5-phosphate isomerase B [Syntrophomonadaceae bacterium]|jgi:RpiB/LacA/LacB family sugar-phosphate isomerase|nr:ribose 5-phosphate isomerase B [Syntrophomonadaceae bacterium]
MILAIGSDHAGFSLKQEIITALQQENHQLIDCGTYSSQSVDYPDIAEKVAHKVLEENILGILICGTGIGISIAANKIRGIRAALCHDPYSAAMAREHNDANIIAIGSRVSGSGIALAMIKTFINTKFQGGRHQLRIEKIGSLEIKCQEGSQASGLY